MFTLFNLKDSSPFSKEELDYIKRMLAHYSITENGLWLQALGYQHFEFRWCPAMLDSGGVMGCFTPIFPGKIFLVPRNPELPPEEGRKFWVEQLFITVVHELRHAWQWKKNKLAYIICALPILREFTLERDANKEQKNSEFFSERWTAKQDYLEAKARGLNVDEMDYLGGEK